MNPFDKRWYCFNDSSVDEININCQNYDNYGNSSPYLLFYCNRVLMKN